MKRTRGRERERVRQYIQQRTVPDLLGRTAGYGRAFDNLTSTNQDCIRVGAKKFNEHLSAMVHGLVQDMVDERSDCRPFERTKTRGTSTWCPFDNTPLVHKHPLDREAVCLACGRVYNRDLLSALASKVRRLTWHERDTSPEHWKCEHAQYRWCKTAWDVLPEKVVRKLQRKITVKVLLHEEQETCAPPLERHAWEVPVREDGGLLPNAAGVVAADTLATSGVRRDHRSGDETAEVAAFTELSKQNTEAEACNKCQPFSNP